MSVGLEPLEVADEGGGANRSRSRRSAKRRAEEEEDSSQVIPLDEVSEDEALLGATPRGAAVEALGDDFAAIPAGG